MTTSLNPVAVHLMKEESARWAENMAPVEVTWPWYVVKELSLWTMVNQVTAHVTKEDVQLRSWIKNIRLYCSVG